MNCPNCNAENENDNVFCVSCGATLVPPKRGATTAPSPTEYYNPSQIKPPENPPDSVQTAFGNQPFYNVSTPSFDASIPYLPTPPTKPQSRKFLWASLAVLSLLVIGGAAFAAYFLFNKPTTTTEILPDHLGMFVQDTEKKNLSEIARQDSANLIQTKDDLLKNDSLPVAPDKPNLLLYSDGKDVPIGDLKLVQLDSIKDDGSLKQINFQAAPIEGKPEIKRLRIPEGLATGKYAFALFDGFLNEGKHKLWAFQVKNAAKTDNGELAKVVTLSIKAKENTASNTNTNAANSTVKPAPTAKPEVVVPAGARVAYCNSSSVVLRNSPSLNARKINSLKRGQKIYIINYSDNTDYWNGMEGNWAYVQTESGSRGWVFSPLIGY